MPVDAFDNHLKISSLRKRVKPRPQIKTRLPCSFFLRQPFPIGSPPDKPERLLRFHPRQRRFGRPVSHLAFTLYTGKTRRSSRTGTRTGPPGHVPLAPFFPDAQAVSISPYVLHVPYIAPRFPVSRFLRARASQYDASRSGARPASLAIRTGKGHTPARTIENHTPQGFPLSNGAKFADNKNNSPCASFSCAFHDSFRNGIH